MNKKIVSLNYVYERMVCEFDHWDYCLRGLFKEDDGSYWWCKFYHESEPDDYDGEDGAVGEGGAGDGERGEILYEIFPIDWNDACGAYLEDYRKAYEHWFHTHDDKGRPSYDGRPLKWFSDKYDHYNVIDECVKWKD